MGTVIPFRRREPGAGLPSGSYPGDVERVRGRLVFVVRRAGARQRLVYGTSWTGDPAGLVFTVVDAVTAGLWARSSREHQVAVLRYPSSWWGGRIRVIVREKCQDEGAAEARAAQLVVAVDRGDFDPS